ncbi:MAG: hypothetical protein F6K19_42595 [Cyanothece sp. SIO1E1]|nr:hypothetical protein [Cyanothece sp. SIO1E1]
MPWSSIGTRSVSYDWRYFDPVVGAELFRVKQNYQNAFPTGPLIIQQTLQLPGEAGTTFRGRSIRLYPSQANEYRLFEFKIPDPLKNEGIIIQDLRARISQRTRVFEFDWAIEVEVFY